MNNSSLKPTATVVGGGPGGLMAAEVLARANTDVTVYDHMASFGRKFQLAGRGGLNLTHGEETEPFLARYGVSRPHLEHALEVFSPEDLRNWCAGLGEPTFVGTSGRVFPESFRATPLLRAWLGRLGDLGVTFKPKHRWKGFVSGSNSTSSFANQLGEQIEVASDVTVVALGGASWPRVGSDGQWQESLAACGVEVDELRASNCGVLLDWSKVLVDRFAGTPLKNVAVKVGKNLVRGDVMLTSKGLEGGPIYAHSAAIRNNLDQHGSCRLLVDLHPDLSFADLRGRFTQRRRPKDSLSTWLRRSGLDPVSRSLLREVAGSDLPSDPRRMASLVKELPLQISGMMPLDRAISSSGGVKWSQLNESLMLKSMPGTFVVGEMIDWEAPTGGYLLQATFSTAVVAAQGAIGWLASRP